MLHNRDVLAVDHLPFVFDQAKPPEFLDPAPLHRPFDHCDERKVQRLAGEEKALRGQCKGHSGLGIFIGVVLEVEHDAGLTSGLCILQHMVVREQ